MATHQEWSVVNIPDVLFFQEGPGVRKWQFRDEGIKLLNVGNINKGKVDLSTTKLYLSEEEANGKYSHFLLDDGDLIIACSGIVLENFHNKISFIEKQHLPLCLNTSTMRFKSLDASKLDINYFRYFLQTVHFNKQLRKLITGSAQLNFGPSHIKKIKIPLPPLAEQKQIAAILDAADALRQKDQQLVEHYTQLSQSLFLDMFGDPVTNPMSWGKIKLGELTSISSGSTPSRDDDLNFNGNIPWVKTTEVNGSLISQTSECISEKGLNESSCKIYPKGSLIIAMYGQGKTRGQVGKLDIDASTNQACAVLSPSAKMNYDFLFSLLKLSYEDLRRQGRGGNQPNLNAGLIKMYTVLSPPILLQNQFAERVEKIEQQKQQAQANLEKSNDLFNALLQKAFTGELTQAGNSENRVGMRA